MKNLTSRLLPRFLALTLGFAATGLFSVSGQTLEKCQPVSADSNKYSFDISLPVPQAVKSIDLMADGKSLGDSAKLDFGVVNDVNADYVCDVVFLVDKAAGGGTATAETDTKAIQSFLKRMVEKTSAINRNRQMTRDQSTKQTSTTPASPGSKSVKIPSLYRVAIATLAGADYQKLAAADSEQAQLNQAIDGINLSTGSQLVSRGIKNVISDLQSSTADRKFLVFVSTGRFNDKSPDLDDVVRAAKDANIKVCTVGFNDGRDDEGLNLLVALTEETEGFSVSTDRVDSDGKFALAEEKLDDLIAYMVAGAKGTFDLTGVTGPMMLRFNVTTDFGKTFTVEKKITAAPATVVSPPIVPSPVPPRAATSGFLVWWITQNPLLAGALGTVLIILLVLVVVVVIRSQAATPTGDVILPTEETSPDSDYSNTEEETKPEPIVTESVLAWLVSSDGETRYPIGTKPVRIGRKADNDIVFRNDSVSLYHAEIIRRDSNFVIVDRASSNKVFIAGRPAHNATLQDRDVIELGDIHLSFQLNHQDDA